MGVAKAKKPRSIAKVQHTWKVARDSSRSVNVTADTLSVVDGDLVFVTNNVTVKVIAANTYTDVDLLAATKD
jgi:hypothetical protein